MSVTFVHAADLHLGSPLRALEGASEEMATRLARASETAFERTITTVIDQEVDFLVVAGDLYDREARSVRANQFLADQFERLEEADIPTYVVHGNHDPLGRGAEKLDLPDNVHVFGTKGVESVSFPEAGDARAELLGQSYSSKHESANFVDSYTPERSGVPTVGILHTALDPDGRKYVPCGIGDLANQDIDYWALGHVHHTRMLDGVVGAYSGIPQPRHAGEPAVGGCLLVELDVGTEPNVEFVPTSSVVWQSAEIDVGRLDSEGPQRIANLTDLEEYLIDEALALQRRDQEEFVDHDISVADTDWEPDGFVCRWILEGRGEVYNVLEDTDEGITVLIENVRDRLEDDDPFVWPETVRDRTNPPLPDRETLVEENEVIAELVELADDLREEPEEREAMREVAGGAWKWMDDPDRESTPDDRVPLTETRLDELIDEATEIAVTQLAANRYDVD